MDITKFQEIIDEKKGEIPENTYLQLSNLCLSYYKKEKKVKENEENFYEITYLYQKYSKVNQYSYDTITINKKEIIKITEKKTLCVIKGIEEDGYFIDDNCSCRGTSICEKLSTHDENETIYRDTQCVECGENEITKMHIKKSPIIIKIKKA